MRCECCDKALSNREATARFANEEAGQPARYVGMCKECQGFLPKSVKILTRTDLDDEKLDSPHSDIDFDYESDENGYEN